MAIVLSPTTIVTAYHCLLDSDNNLIETAKVVKGLERRTNGTLKPEDDIVIPVKVKMRNNRTRTFLLDKNADWIMMERTDLNTFTTQEIRQIYTGNIPTIGKVCIYHSPIELFIAGEIDFVKVMMNEKDIAFCSNHKMFTNNGLFKGSSGGLYASKTGLGYAMHTDSRSARRTVSDEELDNPEGSTLDHIKSASDSNVHVYASLSEGVILSKYNVILNNLN